MSNGILQDLRAGCGVQVGEFCEADSRLAARVGLLPVYAPRVVLQNRVGIDCGAPFKEVREELPDVPGRYAPGFRGQEDGSLAALGHRRPEFLVKNVRVGLYDQAGFSHFVFVCAQNLAQIADFLVHAVQQFLDGVDLDLAALVTLQSKTDRQVLRETHQHGLTGQSLGSLCCKVAKGLADYILCAARKLCDFFPEGPLCGRSAGFTHMTQICQVAEDTEELFLAGYSEIRCLRRIYRSGCCRRSARIRSRGCSRSVAPASSCPGCRRPGSRCAAASGALSCGDELEQFLWSLDPVLEIFGVCPPSAGRKLRCGLGLTKTGVCGYKTDFVDTNSIGAREGGLQLLSQLHGFRLARGKGMHEPRQFLRCDGRKEMNAGQTSGGEELGELAFRRSAFQRHPVQKELGSSGAKKQARLSPRGDGFAQFLPGGVQLFGGPGMLKSVEPGQFQENIQAAHKGAS